MNRWEWLFWLSLVGAVLSPVVFLERGERKEERPPPLEVSVASELEFERCSCDGATWCLNDEQVMWVNVKLSERRRGWGDVAE